MAEKAGMIEPFEPGQVRQVDGRRVISYGTSSYGYDIRCANEFKIFTNINSTIVIPKTSIPKTSLPSKTTAASSRPIPSHWRVRSNTSVSRATS